MRGVLFRHALDTHMTVVCDSHYQSTLDAVCIPQVTSQLGRHGQESAIVPCYLHYPQFAEQAHILAMCGLPTQTTTKGFL